MDLPELVFEPATEQARLIRLREVSPVELTEAYLERIEAHDGGLGSFVTVADATARQAARAAQEQLGSPDLPSLHGVPVSVKELNDVAGLPSSSGLAAYQHRVATGDDSVVRRMRTAGCVILGKTASPALGIGCVTEPAGFPPTRNPWDRTRTPGGSSGGAGAALAAALCAVSHGSDGGGSIRIPASWCGLVGLKPSRGRVSSAPRSNSLLATSGPIARTVLDVATLLDVMSGPEPGDAFWAAPPQTPFAAEVGRDPGRLRIALSLGGREVAPEVAAALQTTAALLESLGHHVEPADPDPTWGRVIEESLPDTGAPGLAAVVAALPTRDGLDPLVAALAAYTEPLPAEAVANAEARMTERARRALVFLSSYDALLCPTTAKSPPHIGEHRELDVLDLFAMWESYVPFTTMWNYTGQPAISVPVGLDGNGLPMGMQLVGRPADDAGLLRLAGQLETAIAWTQRPPTYDVRRMRS
jgi:amidase